MKNRSAGRRRCVSEAQCRLDIRFLKGGFETDKKLCGITGRGVLAQKTTGGDSHCPYPVPVTY